ncbi:hypothetical protein F5B20DRAFT_548749 [Whalleya microplaca]|nr:hypothetical protein F5B20DRAFT_548749 [Whalleya microplaca]
MRSIIFLVTLLAAAITASPIGPHQSSNANVFEKRGQDSCCICILYAIAGGVHGDDVANKCLKEGHCASREQYRNMLREMLTCATEYAPYFQWSDEIQRRWRNVLATSNYGIMPGAISGGGIA